MHLDSYRPLAVPLCEFKTMSKVRATDETLGVLHQKLAEHLLNRISSGEASAQELSAAIKFLKDNKIESLIAEGDTLDKLYKSLPQFDESDEESEYVN